MKQYSWGNSPNGPKYIRDLADPIFLFVTFRKRSKWKKAYFRRPAWRLQQAACSLARWKRKTGKSYSKSSLCSSSGGSVIFWQKNYRDISQCPKDWKNLTSFLWFEDLKNWHNQSQLVYFFRKEKSVLMDSLAEMIFYFQMQAWWQSDLFFARPGI